MDRSNGGTRRRYVVAAALALACAAIPITPSAASVPAAIAPGASATADALVVASHQTAVWRGGTTITLGTPGGAPLSGRFSAASGADILFFGYDSYPDHIVHVAKAGTGATASARAITIGGRYTPFVGDFDGNGIDDVFWYNGRPNADFIWFFHPDGSYTSRRTDVNGAFQPVVVDTDGNGVDDIIWYGYLGARDYIWRFTPGGGHTSEPIAIGGHFDGIVGHFGNRPAGEPQQQVVWYDHLGNDYAWTFDRQGGHTSRRLPAIDRRRVPKVGHFLNHQDAIFLFVLGGGPANTMLGFDDAGVATQYAAPALVINNGPPTVGDFDGDGYDDLAAQVLGGTRIWYFKGYRHTHTSTLLSGLDGGASTARL